MFAGEAVIGALRRFKVAAGVFIDLLQFGAAEAAAAVPVSDAVGQG